MAGSAAAQQQDLPEVSSPFQEEYEYAIGEELTPDVVIDGIRWSLVRVAVRGDRELEVGKQIPVDVSLAFSSARSVGVTVQVALLLEDENGGELERIKCLAFRVGAGRSKEVRQKHRVAGESLLETRRLYVYASVE